jgi:hypothetical protein
MDNVAVAAYRQRPSDTRRAMGDLTVDNCWRISLGGRC